MPINSQKTFTSGQSNNLISLDIEVSKTFTSNFENNNYHYKKTNNRLCKLKILIVNLIDKFYSWID